MPNLLPHRTVAIVRTLHQVQADLVAIREQLTPTPVPAGWESCHDQVANLAAQAGIALATAAHHVEQLADAQRVLHQLEREHCSEQ